MIFLCGFDIYFSNNLWCWASYHVPVIVICMSCLVSLGILPIFRLGLFWALWASCVFWVLTSSQSYHLQIFSTIWCVVFSCCLLFLLLCKNCSVWCSPICLFLLLFLLPQETDSRKYCYGLYKSVLPMFTSRRFMEFSLSFRSLKHFVCGV